ncbi:hypothetical protein EDB19DRAFT_1710015 [Suillus lakei]|nr:hypothetical protein EDB19DRAFT_1710015 [Suillus lakei]
MTAYVPKGEVPVMTFITTDVDSNLMNWTMTLAEEYCTSVVGSAKLFARGSSDHILWYRVPCHICGRGRFVEDVQLVHPHVGRQDGPCRWRVFILRCDFFYLMYIRS